jgi:hypothetical protein
VVLGGWQSWRWVSRSFSCWEPSADTL